MKIGFIGLGRMGLGLSQLLVRRGHTVVGFNRSPGPLRRAARFGVRPATRIPNLVRQLPEPRIIWLMVPAEAVSDVLRKLQPRLRRGDIVIDGGNSNYRDSQQRARRLKQRGIAFLDVGTSGGLLGARTGVSLMIGGDRRAFQKTLPILKAVAAPKSFVYLGPSGAGHLVKTIHNGIEYAFQQAIGEGLEILSRSPLKLDLRNVVKAWQHGSVIRSWLVDLAGVALRRSDFKRIAPVIGGGETGRWTVDLAKQFKVRTPVIAAALKERASSKRRGTFQHQVVAAIRREMGGHPVVKRR